MISNRPNKTMQTFRCHHKVGLQQHFENTFFSEMLKSYKTIQIDVQRKKSIKQMKQKTISKTISLDNRIKFNEQKLVCNQGQSKRKNTVVNFQTKKLTHSRVSSLSNRTFYSDSFQDINNMSAIEGNMWSPYLLRKMQIAREKIKQKRKLLIIGPSQNISQRDKKPAYRNFIKIAHGIRIENEFQNNEENQRKSPRLNFSSQSSYRARAYQKFGFTVKYNQAKSSKKTLAVKKKDFLRPWSGAKSILLGNNQQPENCELIDNFS